MHAQLARWHLRVERKSQVEARPLSMDETPLPVTSAGPAPAMIVAPSREQSTTNRLQVGHEPEGNQARRATRASDREPADSEHARAQEVASTVTHTGRSTKDSEAPGRGGSTTSLPSMHWHRWSLNS